MAFSLLALLDDISSVLDDVAVMTKIAARKTAGVLGDDLALNAQQVSGVAAERELPVVWGVAKGSLVNKAILIPLALVLSEFAPWLVQPLLMLGGAYLCYEGAEKIFHRFFRHEVNSEQGEIESSDSPTAALAELEKRKIKGAIRTDFVLSAEIIVISLGTISTEALFLTRAAVLVAIGLVMTVGVYGLVAGIVKLDDLGFFFMRKRGLLNGLGSALVKSTPFMMRGLTIVGTAAMFLVGGGILAHGLPFIYQLAAAGSTCPWGWLWPMILNALSGIVAGAILLAAVHFGSVVCKKIKTSK
ncbi:DUF808 domain-containing protein [Deltaproteobacteria bacterium OttesenSCG-928-K17]|nr:DUF808 domain-containing protein [Deltaproteobacteria bacterium OttesenSCG-928-K17]